MTQTIVRVCLAMLVLAGPASAADLRITDTRGTEVVVAGATIDYSGFLASDRETDGIRVLQGEGTVTVKWADIDTLTITGKDDSAKPPRLTIELLLRNGKKIPAALVQQGLMKLQGKTELGDYSIDLAKVRKIAPVR